MTLADETRSLSQVLCNSSLTLLGQVQTDGKLTQWEPQCSLTFAQSYTPLAVDDVPPTRVKQFPGGGFVSIQSNASDTHQPSFSYAYGPKGMSLCLNYGIMMRLISFLYPTVGLKGLLQNPYTFASALFASIGGLTYDLLLSTHAGCLAFT